MRRYSSGERRGALAVLLVALVIILAGLAVRCGGISVSGGMHPSGCPVSAQGNVRSGGDSTDVRTEDYGKDKGSRGVRRGRKRKSNGGRAVRASGGRTAVSPRASRDWLHDTIPGQYRH